MAQKIKKGDNVLVVSGRNRGQRGVVERVNNKRKRVMVNGVNIVKKHIGSRRGVTQTGIIEEAAPIHVSNVVLIDANTGEIGRVRWRTLEDGTQERTVRGKRNG